MDMAADQLKSSPLTERDPDATIALAPDGRKTVADLLLAASVLADRLPEGRFALNLHTNRFDYLVGFCAAMMAGHCTLMPPNRQPGTLDEIGRHYPGFYLVGEEEDLQQPAASCSINSAPITAPIIEERQAAIVAFTSGSTGEPAATEKSWHTLRISTQNNFTTLLSGVDEAPGLVATVPCQHMWGFEVSVLLPLLCDTAISYRSPLYAPDIAEALAEVPTPAVLISSPLHLRALMRSGVKMPPVARILTATAPLSTSEAQAFESHFETEVLDAFGCTESGVIATRRTALVENWTLAPAFRLEASDDQTQICANHLPEPVLLPDVVELIDDHSFKWLGRNQDMIKIAGKRGSLADLNTRLARIDGIRDGVIFHPQGAERLAAMVVAPDMEVSDILDALRPQIEPAFMPRPVLQVDELPRQESGKLSQSAVTGMYESLRSSSTSG